MALTRYGQVPDGADPEEARARERDLVRTVVAGRGLQIRVGIAPDARVQRRYGAMGVPTLALIDRQGQGPAHGLGGDEAVLEAAIEACLAEAMTPTPQALSRGEGARGMVAARRDGGTTKDGESMAGDSAGPGGAGSGQEPVEGLPPGARLGPPPGLASGAGQGSGAQQEAVEGLPPGVKLGPPPGIRPAAMAVQAGDLPEGEVVQGPPPGVKLGRPPGIPAGAMAQGGKEEIDELPPGVVLGEVGPPQFPAMSAVPYIGRSLTMLKGHLPIVITAVSLAFVVTALPFVSSAAFGPLMQMLGVAAAEGSLTRVWQQSAPLVDGGAGLLGTPRTFLAVLMIWAGALVLGQILGFVRSYLEAQLEWRLLTAVRQRAHDHLQSLSLDFFTGERSGSLMQRVLMEASSIQRLHHPVPDPADRRDRRAGAGAALPAGALLADDDRGAGALAAGDPHLQVRRPEDPGDDQPDGDEQPAARRRA